MSEVELDDVRDIMFEVKKLGGRLFERLCENMGERFFKW